MEGRFRVRNIKYNEEGKLIATVILTGDKLKTVKQDAKVAGVSIKEYVSKFVKENTMCFNVEI